MRTFEEIAQAQGWTANTQLDLLLRYVANQSDDAALRAFAEDVAAEENAGSVCDECGELIPDTEGGGLANRHHAQTCSLYDADHD